jgi:hypothetical protein
VINLSKPGRPATWGEDLKAVARVAPEFVVSKPGASLPRLITDEPAVKPVS